MKYHNITTDDMLNGEGLRTVLWVSGCDHYCEGCHNQITWDSNVGLEFNNDTILELIFKSDKPYISGITLSGGDPLYKNNIEDTLRLCYFYKKILPSKTIWLYTGYVYEDIIKTEKGEALLSFIDVLVDGKFEKNLASEKYQYAGSTNQRIIDVKETIKNGEIVLYKK